MHLWGLGDESKLSFMEEVHLFVNHCSEVIDGLLECALIYLFDDEYRIHSCISGKFPPQRKDVVHPADKPAYRPA